MPSILSTEQMLATVKARAYITEAVLTNGVVNSTHWIEYWDGRYYDEGCDGVRRRTSRKAMLADYPRANWHVAEAS